MSRCWVEPRFRWAEGILWFSVRTGHCARAACNTFTALGRGKKTYGVHVREAKRGMIGLFPRFDAKWLLTTSHLWDEWHYQLLIWYFSGTICFSSLMTENLECIFQAQFAPPFLYTDIWRLLQLIFGVMIVWCLITLHKRACFKQHQLSFGWSTSRFVVKKNKKTHSSYEIHMC